MLQWGRGGEAAESFTACRFFLGRFFQLQWGRGGEAAESLDDALKAGTITVASMGPRR